MARFRVSPSCVNSPRSRPTTQNKGVVPEFKGILAWEIEKPLIRFANLWPPPLDSAQGIVHFRLRRNVPILFRERQTAAVDGFVEVERALVRAGSDQFLSPGKGFLSGRYSVWHDSSFNVSVGFY